VRPYVPDQSVSVSALLGRRLIKSERLLLEPSRGHAYGRFSMALSSPGVGTVEVVVAHAATTALEGFRVTRSFSVLDEKISFGSTGPFVDLIQQRLAALHFYIPQTGVYDAGTGLALDAYHRLLRWGTSQTLDGRTISWLLDSFGAFKVRDPRGGKHAEGNLSEQLLALVNGSQVYRIYPISSGKPSTPTILGHFHVYAKVPGYLPDGMYDSSFFIGGYAIHGYDPAPNYPASHGCMRLPIADALSVYDWLKIGDVVDTYY
jgi:L,D-transpeptidase catalytic domain